MSAVEGSALVRYKAGTVVIHVAGIESKAAT